MRLCGGSRGRGQTAQLLHVACHVVSNALHGGVAGLVSQRVLPYQLSHPVMCGGRGGGKIIRREMTHTVHLVTSETRARTEQIRLTTSDTSAGLGKLLKLVP